MMADYSQKEGIHRQEIETIKLKVKKMENLRILCCCLFPVIYFKLTTLFTFLFYSAWNHPQLATSSLKTLTNFNHIVQPYTNTQLLKGNILTMLILCTNILLKPAPQTYLTIAHHTPSLLEKIVVTQLIKMITILFTNRKNPVITLWNVDSAWMERFVSMDITLCIKGWASHY